MKISTKVICYTLMTTRLLSLQPCRAAFFKMTLERNSIWAPGKMKLSIELTDRAKIEGAYRVKVSIYVTGTLVRKQILPVTKKAPTIFELMFPNVRSTTEVRSRAELFIDGEFVEAREKPLTLWPAIAPYPRESANKLIWAFDTSGKLQKLFRDLKVEATDASFQAARDFGTPSIVFIGQYTDPRNLQVITDRVMSVSPKPVIVFLRQRQLLRNARIEIPTENNRSQNVVCDVNAPLLNGLSRRDIMNMVDNAIYVRIKRIKGKDKTVDSYVTEATADKKSICSYLCMVEEKGQVIFYCQLPITDDDPRFHILFKNLLKSADIISDSIKNQANRHSERTRL